MKKVIGMFVCILFVSMAWTQENNRGVLSGAVKNETGYPVQWVSVRIENTEIGSRTNSEGHFTLRNIPYGNHILVVGMVGFSQEKIPVTISGRENNHVDVVLRENAQELKEVEVFGTKEQMPEKLDFITRLPIKPSESIQTISVISDKLIEAQGALTITDAVRNVPGVTLFGSYGNVRESMSARGYRGMPVLKNGVRMDSDFRTGSMIADMQGVESIQVIKGATSITQGVGNDLGSPGGIINVVTKTPKFYNGGEVSLRVGSWGQVRPTFDVQTVLDKSNTSAVRINGAFERADGFRAGTAKNRTYFNPSFAWRPGKKTQLDLEVEYLYDATTPDRGTVNLDADSVFALYEMPFNKFLGFTTDKAYAKNLSYSARMVHELNKNLSVRAAFVHSDYNVDQIGAGALNRLRNSTDYAIRSRTIGRSLKEDKNSVLQLDFIGKEIYTGKIKHTFQVGFDYRLNNLSTTAYNSLVVDTINVLQAIPNILPDAAASIGLTPQDPVKSSSYSYGLMAQEIITFNKYLKAVLGIRYSYGDSKTETATGATVADAWNPMLGIMISPVSNINVFGSYTTTTSLRGAANIQLDRVTPVGPSESKQWEAGFKSDWLNKRLRFNVTAFIISNNNLSYSEYDAAGVATGYYGLAGDLNRKGVEVELAGRPMRNLQLVAGYAYLDARYKNSPAYMENSKPMNAPDHTANAWAQYVVNKGTLTGLSFGAGVYYVGERPVNEYTKKVIIHNTEPGVKPFNMPAYTTVNAQLGYAKGRIGARLLFNNIFDALGYNSYFRGGYINQIEPRNFAAVLTYKF